MRKLIAFAVLNLAAGAVPAEPLSVANHDGTERVCVFGMAAQSEQGFREALQQCKRGDVLEIGWAKLNFALQICDFTKAVVAVVK
jgi:hypothetical protein